MKVLSIGTDSKLFDTKSAVFLRIKKYAEKMEEMHVIVFTLKKNNLVSFKSENLFVYSTNSITQWFYVVDALRLGYKIIKSNSENKKDIVVSSQDPFLTGFVGVRLSQKFKIPLQIQIHTDFLSLHFSESFLNKIRKVIALYVVPHASGLRVVSNKIKYSLQKRFKNLKNVPQVLPVYVDIEKIIQTTPKRNIVADFPGFNFIIFMASRLAAEKRFDIALKTLKKVVRTHPHVGLVIAGSGPQKDNILEMAKELGVEKNVRLIGWQDDLISYFKTCSIFLLTSEYEGYGMTLVEAGASGAKIVTTRVGIAESDLFTNKVNCYICEVGDVDSLSESVLHLINNQAEGEVISQKIQDSIKSQTLSLDEYSSQYVKLLSDLIEG